MNRIILGLSIIAASLAFGVWFWRRNYQPSPLEIHLADLQFRSNIGAVVNSQHYYARPAWATVGSGVLTAARINPNNPAQPAYNSGQTLNLYPRSPSRV